MYIHTRTHTHTHTRTYTHTHTIHDITKEYLTSLILTHTNLLRVASVLPYISHLHFANPSHLVGMLIASRSTTYIPYVGKYLVCEKVGEYKAISHFLESILAIHAADSQAVNCSPFINVLPLQNFPHMSTYVYRSTYYMYTFYRKVMGIISLNDIAQKTLNGQCKGDQSVMDVEKLVTQKYKQVSTCTHAVAMLSLCLVLSY